MGNFSLAAMEKLFFEYLCQLESTAYAAGTAGFVGAKHIRTECWGGGWGPVVYNPLPFSQLQDAELDAAWSFYYFSFVLSQYGVDMGWPLPGTRTMWEN